MDSILWRIGERDRWICGICQDPQRPVWKPPDAVTLSPDLVVVEGVPADEVIDGPYEGVEDIVARDRRHPLAAVIDHIKPKSQGGSNDPSNLQIAHRRCNALKHDKPAPIPAYAAAKLSHVLDGTPIPLFVYQQQHGGRLPPPFRLERGQVAMEGWQLLPEYQDYLARKAQPAEEKRRWRLRLFLADLKALEVKLSSGNSSLA